MIYRIQDEIEKSKKIFEGRKSKFIQLTQKLQLKILLNKNENTVKKNPTNSKNIEKNQNKIKEGIFKQFTDNNPKMSKNFFFNNKF